MFRSLERYRVIGRRQDIVPIGQHSEEEGGHCPWASTPLCGFQEKRGSQVSRKPNLDMTNSLISINVKMKYSNMPNHKLIKYMKGVYAFLMIKA
jgi:hypothetical protein